MADKLACINHHFIPVDQVLFKEDEVAVKGLGGLVVWGRIFLVYLKYHLWI